MEGIVHKQLFILSPPIPSHYYTHCWKFIGGKKKEKAQATWCHGGNHPQAILNHYPRDITTPTIGKS